jgi:hypothetical protein
LQKFKNFEKDYLGLCFGLFFRRRRGGNGLLPKNYPAKKDQDVSEKST